MLAAPHQNPRWSSISPKESVFSVGTHDTDHVLMGKQEFEEVELEDGTRTNGDQPKDYTANPRFKFCFLGLCIYVFLFALDAFIITSAVPQLLNDFQEGEKLAFLNSAFFIPCAGFICLFSQIMTIFRPKMVYLACCVVFLAGCGICGASSSMNMLIIGRAVAGLGGAGLWAATFIVAGEMIPLVKRPALFGLFGMVFLVASVGGPILGGAFTDMGRHGWRWCFYISLPIGGAFLPVLAWTLPKGQTMLPFDGKLDPRPVWKRALRMDWIGALLCVGWVTCFGISLQWGGITKEWNSSPVLVLLVLAPVLLFAFIGWSIWMKSRAMLPIPLLRSRHLWGGLLVSLFGYGVTVIALYYLSIYFQAIKGKTATKGGLLLLALQLAMCPTIVIVSKIVERKGHMWPSIPFGGALVAIGCGLFYTFEPTTTTAKIIGYQILVGVGLGAILNVMIVIVQADYVTRPAMEPHATTLQNWFGFVGRIIGITVATNLFENKLKMALQKTGYLSGAAIGSIVSSPGAIKALPSEMQAHIRLLYNEALNKVWIVCVALACTCFLSSFLLKRLNMVEIHAGLEAEIALKEIGRAEPPRAKTDSRSSES